MTLDVIGIPFVFNGIASEKYKMSIVNINNDYNETVTGSGVEFTTDTLARSAKVLFINATQSPVLEFPLEFVCNNPMDRYTFNQVKDWLFGGNKGFQELRICLRSMKSYYFNCQLKPDNNYQYVDGFRGFKCTVVCDAPWAWEYIRTKKYVLTTSDTNTIKFRNESADKNDMLPIIEFTLADGVSNFSITNTSLNNYLFEMTSLSPLETITADSEKKTIVSSTGLYRIGKMTKSSNKGFIRLKQGVNVLTCVGKVILTIKYQNAVRLDGGLYE